ncbi:MAG TPA: L,D-transpeptidase [Xanthobacteraceae bacterium]|jgi:lipoprotein-anchoring transpeptidase ErfK/SrfK|nr:L,D-transpeptidase [Xanthobacteraceae bacterium]
MNKLKRLGLAPLVATVFGLAAAAPAQADLVVHISKGAQRMTVVRDGQPIHTWVVSTGRSGYGTPSGVFHPQRMARTWFSKAYYNSPMPYSIFFYGGYAIHGTYAINQLGGPASHGCVRLYPGNAATLFSLVAREGAGRTTIIIN